MSGELLGIAILIAAVVFVVVAADRRRTIAVVIFERGNARATRGRLPARVMSEVRDVAERMRIGSGTLTIRRESGVARVDLRGIDDARAAQQLRNVIGRFRLAELRG
jgi:hypothetical protein